MISTLVALTDQLETVEKVLSKEKAARLTAEQSCAEEMIARQAADQSL
jgi:hypothetical protein